MTSSLYELLQSPKGSALLWMGASSAMHFSAYEFSRSAILALFTSETTGFHSDGALPLAVGCVGPFSFLLLWRYAFILETKGPRIALRSSNLLSVLSLLAGCLVMRCAESSSSESESASSSLRILSKICIFSLFVSQNSLVQLLFTQHWAFIGSIGNGAKEGSIWFAPVAGIGSIASTLAAYAVGPMADLITLPGLLLVAAMIMMLSGIGAEFAYHMAEKNGFDPHEEKIGAASGSKKRTESEEKGHRSLYQKTRSLFQRVPILGFLCGEVIFCQCLSAVITFMFVRQVKLSIGDDQLRAGWTGNCYAWINGVSGLLQFCIIPWIVPFIDIFRLWPMMPSIMFLLLLVLSLDGGNHGLTMVATAFCTMKTLEYSLRGVSNEMLFASLDYESRFVAKQEIGMLANRFAKSFTAVALSLLTKYVASVLRLEEILSWTACLLALLWGFVSYELVAKMNVPGSKVKKQ